MKRDTYREMSLFMVKLLEVRELSLSGRRVKFVVHSTVESSIALQPRRNQRIAGRGN
jgi:hypothetical protein